MSRTLSEVSQVLRVGVSRCLLGERVRYDGRHKCCPGLQAELARLHLQPVPVCPEVEAGLGVPRPPMQLVRRNGGTRLMEVEAPRADRTEVLTRAARRLAGLENISGFILKSGSPSCGLAVSVFDDRAQAVAWEEGLFVQCLRAGRPGLPIIDEIRWADRKLRLKFLAEVKRYGHGPQPFPPAGAGTCARAGA